jgi:hypothetical protein
VLGIEALVSLSSVAAKGELIEKVEINNADNKVFLDMLNSVLMLNYY